MRLNPIHHTRTQNGAGTSSSRLGNERPTGTRTRSNSARSPVGKSSEDGIAIKGQDQAWAIGDLSDDDSDEGLSSKNRASTSRPRTDDERGGLLSDEAEEEEEARIQPGAKPSVNDTPPNYESVDKRDLDDDEDDPFGDFEQNKPKGRTE
jgi:hypothetical protein